jgi:hypothetical protein
MIVFLVVFMQLCILKIVRKDIDVELYEIGSELCPVDYVTSAVKSLGSVRNT